ncbi:Mth938-like domain-containing protein [Oceanicaulis sp. LC35]|uniref:Mth938-like domain-containing protein n=1 Tax=Oceanicaulis sp. LC35 TaxID=3349635 RepID=UPI003F84DA45
MPRNANSISLPPIDAFGDGGFRIAGVRKEGATLIVDGAARGWTRQGDELSVDDLRIFLDRPDRPDMLVLGVGERLIHPPASVRKAFREAGIGLEVMDTATACRTYNLLAGEGRNIAAALLPV